MKNLFFKLSTVVCSLALFAAVTSIGTMCIGNAYQPKAPKSMDKYRK